VPLRPTAAAARLTDYPTRQRGPGHIFLALGEAIAGDRREISPAGERLPMSDAAAAPELQFL
jgi:hypothetical protein